MHVRISPRSKPSGQPKQEKCRAMMLFSFRWRKVSFQWKVMSNQKFPLPLPLQINLESMWLISKGYITSIPFIFRSPHAVLNITWAVTINAWWKPRISLLLDEVMLISKMIFKACFSRFRSSWMLVHHLHYDQKQSPCSKILMEFVAFKQPLIPAIRWQLSKDYRAWWKQM